MLRLISVTVGLLVGASAQDRFVVKLEAARISLHQSRSAEAQKQLRGGCYGLVGGTRRNRHARRRNGLPRRITDRDAQLARLRQSGEKQIARNVQTVFI
jgi:hypothetical protein